MHKLPYLRALLDCMLIGIVAAVVIIISLSVPVLNIVLLFMPVPFILLINKWDIRYGLLSLAITIVLIRMILFDMSSIFIFLMIAPIVIIFGITIKRKYSSLKTIILGAVSVLASAAVYAGIFALNTNTDIFEYFTYQMLELLNQTIDYYKQIGINDNTVYLLKQMDEADIQDLIRIIIPSSIIIYSLSYSFLNYFIGIKFLKKYKYDVKDIPPFCEWKLSRDTARGLIGITIAAYIGNLLGISNFDIVLTCTYTLVTLLFLVQGLSVVDFYIKGLGIRQFARVLLEIFILFVFWVLLIIIGFIDQFATLRKKEKV